MADVKLNLVVIRAEDIDRAAEFYRLLGLEFRKDRHGSGPEHYSCEQGELVFEIYPRQKRSEGAAGTRLGFCVPSLDALIADLEGIGARIVSRPKESPWGRRAVIEDPDGHRVELTEPPLQA